jgi:Ku70/Ku80 beta-barrel domain
MPPPGLLTGNLAVGLVNVPIRLYTATRTEGIACHLLHARRGSLIQNQSSCPVSNVVVSREELVRGFAFTKDEHVRSTAASGDGPRPPGGDRTPATGHDGLVAETPLDLADEHLWLHQRFGSGGARHSSIPFGAVSRKPYSACG